MWSKTMAATALALTLAGGFLVQVPFTTALDWTAGLVDDQSWGLGVVHVTTQGSTVYASYYDALNDDLKIAKSRDGGLTWPTGDAALSAGDVGGSHEIQALTNQLVVGCAYQAPVGDLLFVKTTDGGVVWAQTAITTTGDVGYGCGIDAVDASTYVVVYGDATQGNTKYAKSTNAGASWTTGDVISAPISGQAHIAAKDADEWLILLAQGTTLRSCATTNAGVTWTCQALLEATGGHLDLEHVEGDVYAATHELAGATQLRFGRTDDHGATWGFATVHAYNNDCLASGTSLSHVGTQAYAIALACGGQSTPREHPLRIATSNDAGQTWTVEAPGAEAYPSTRTSGGVGVVIAPTGKVVYAYVRCDTNAPCDNGASDVRSGVADFGGLLAPAATVEVDQLVGFDVDPDGSVVITREAPAGNTVRTYTAGTLTPYDVGVDTDCGKPDAVFAMRAHVAFLACDAASGQVLTMRIANHGLGAPNFGRCHYCPNYVNMGDFANGQTHPTQVDIVDLYAYPLSMDAQLDTPFFVCSQISVCDFAFSSWGFATTGGYLGADFYTAHNNHLDRYHTSEEPYSALQPHQVCTAVSQENGRTYLMAVLDTQSTQVFRVDFDLPDRPEEIYPVFQGLDGELVYVYSMAPSLGQARGIACAGDAALVAPLDGDEVRIYAVNYRTGQIRWPLSTSAAIKPDWAQPNGLITRGLALSADASWGAYYDYPFIRIVNMTDGSVAVNVPVPEGTFHELELSRKGDQLWVAMRERIHRYAVWPYTTQQPVNEQVPEIVRTGDDEGQRMGGASLVPNVPTFQHPQARALLWALVIVGPMIGAWKLTGGSVGRNGQHWQPGNPLVIGLSGYAGMCVAVPWVGFPLWIPIAVAVVGLLGFFLARHWTGGD